MPYEPVLDVEELLRPIQGENPSGANLMYEGLHDDIKEARRADDVLEQGEWKREPKTADWHKVEELAAGALATRTKDRQVCSWLTEALVHLHGFSGLIDGLKLTRGLLESYRDALYPEMDEEDLEARANAIGVFNLPFFTATVQGVPLTSSAARACSFLDWKDSSRFDVPENWEELEYEERERISQRKATAEAEGKITSEQWRISKNSSNRAFYEDLSGIVKMCREECASLDGIMDEKFARQAPGLTELKKALDGIATLVESVLKEKRILEPDPVADLEVAAGEGEAVQAGPAGAAAGPVRSRQEALRRLAEVADYFRVTEPHSPVSYLLQRAIRWGQMPLEAWLDEVVKDSSALAQVLDTLGLKAGERE